MLRLFADNLLPVFLAAGTGYWVKARLALDARPITQVAFYVLAPCLVFDVIVANRVGGVALLTTGGFALLTLLALAALAALISRAFGWSRTMTAAIVLVVLLPNAGNFGLSVNLFAFGEAGLAAASTFFVASSVLTFTVGVFVASLGRAGWGTAASRLVRTPAIWAVALAFLFLAARWALPLPLERTVKLFSSACIPTFLLVLGMQLHGRKINAQIGPLVVATTIRLAGGAILALVLAATLGLEGAARQAGVLQASMPSAVICTIIATEYDLEPDFVASVVLVTTLACPFTLTPLLAHLGARSS